jgi:hypothetical protein
LALLPLISAAAPGNPFVEAIGRRRDAMIPIRRIDSNLVKGESSQAQLLHHLFHVCLFFKGLRRRAGLLAPQEVGWLDCYWSG